MIILISFQESSFQDTGLTTAAMKLKRKPLQEFYKEDLDRMYGH